MYNRYLEHAPLAQTPIATDHAVGHAHNQFRERPDHPRSEQHPTDHMLGELSNALGDLLGGVSKHFTLGDVDTGDILLVLIILLLFLDGDDLELVITLGLMLLLGLGDD